MMFPFFYLVSNWKRDVGDAGGSKAVLFSGPSSYEKLQKRHQERRKQWFETQSKNPLFQIRQVMWNHIQQKKPIVLKDGQEIRLFELPEEQARQYLRHFIKTNHPDLYDERVEALIDATYKHSTKAKIRLNEHIQLLMSSKRNQKQSKEIAKKTDDLRIYFERQGYWSAIEDLNKMVQDFNQNIGR